MITVILPVGIVPLKMYPCLLPDMIFPLMSIVFRSEPFVPVIAPVSAGKKGRKK